jgi:hypothetical protein
MLPYFLVITFHKELHIIISAVVAPAAADDDDDDNNDNNDNDGRCEGPILLLRIPMGI